MSALQRLDVDLTLQGPILTASSEPGELGVDVPVARDAMGFPMLPYSLVKGKVRDALLRLDQKAIARAWLGKDNPGDRDDALEERGRLRFTDFVADRMGDRGTTLERIEIDPATGTVGDRMLAFFERPFAAGERVRFCGRVEFIGSDDEVKTVRHWVSQALRFTPSFGGERSVGFGRTHDVSVKTQPAAGPTATNGQAPTGAWLTFDGPICVGGKKHSRNSFRSLDAIPGSVLKGAVARMLLDLVGQFDKQVVKDLPSPWTELGNNFHAIRVSHAIPVEEGGSIPSEPPLSLALFEGKNEPVDLAWVDQSELVHGTVPRFAIDWKDYERDHVRERWGWKSPPRSLRVRTAIDENTGRAKDEHLYSYEVVEPRAKDRKPFRWRVEFGFEGVDAADRAKVEEQWWSLLSLGVHKVGKTRTSASVEFFAARSVSEELEPGETVAVVLQTPALLVDPKVLRSGTKLFDAYREFWSDVSGSLHLLRCFAKQSLHGGQLARRAMRDDSFEPFFVTEPGSVFVLEVKAGVKDRDDDWLRRGLPLPSWAAQRYGDPVWRHCPFVRENGFGAVVVRRRGG